MQLRQIIAAGALLFTAAIGWVFAQERRVDPQRRVGG